MVRYNPKIDEGLNDSQVKNRFKNHLVNHNNIIKTKSIRQIIFYNIFNLFNILNFFLAIIILSVKSYKNLLFLGVIFCNTLISIMQEIKSKREIDKLSIISSLKATVIRNKKNVVIDTQDVVLDDIIVYKRGNQVVADSIIIDGNVEVNESFLSGEENSISKKKSDMLYAGSFIVSGNCTCRVEKVGMDNYSSKICIAAKYMKKVNSVIMNTLKKIIKIVSIVIIPLGILLFLKQYNLSNNSLTDAILNTSAAILGMIPEGLILLTSTVLAVSTIKLSKRNVLVQQLYCIETLARVDTICLDKTGTITEGKMEVEKVIPLSNSYDYKNILSIFSRELLDDTQTMDAISKKFNKNIEYEIISKEYFSSEKKYSTLTLKDNKYYLGSPDVLSDSEDIKTLINENSDYRLLLLKSDDDNIALILLKDLIRYQAYNTLKYLKNEGVDIKIISGDNEKTILSIAKRLGLTDLKSIDMTKSITNKTHKIVNDYNIFCRVTPQQKKDLILALKDNGHTVAMTGDGVNDVLALKEADCSIAMSSGADAARNVAEIVLLDSDFSSIPEILKEGRRTINNVQRSASLFLTKTIYSTLLAIIFLLLPLKYPFQPIQLSLISSLTIGIPAFLLSFEKNYSKINGNFLVNVIKKSIPSGFMIVINICFIMFTSLFIKFDFKELSTISVIITGLSSFILLYKLFNKFNLYKIILFIGLIFIFLTGIIFFPYVFEIINLKFIYIIFILLILLLDIALFNFIEKICNKLFK